ncbi:MAG: flagellar hook-associated protein FlgK [Planctomycetota bacterium]
MSLFIGLSGIRASQVGLDVISQNITNAGTEGYHRQNVHFEALNDNLFNRRRIGSGVRVQGIERVRFSVVESFITETTSDLQRADQTFSLQRQVESLLLPGEGSLQSALDSLFNNISSLSSAPSDQTTRDLAVASGAELANQFREISGNLDEIRQQIVGQINSELSVLNNELVQLGELNQEIVVASATSGQPNELLDIRDRIINSIAEKVDISRIESNDGNISLTFGNYSVQRTVTNINFSLEESTEDNTLSLSYDGGDRSLQLNSGRISALIDAYNELIPSYDAQLDELAGELIRRFDSVHATGVGHDGGFANIVGSRGVESPNTLLSNAGTAFPVTAGDLYITITDPNGGKRLERLAIDPETQTLEDIATAIGDIPNLSASINSTTNQLRIVASSGYKFDFTGNIPTVPTLTNFTGSSSVELSGLYDGDANGRYNFAITGSGNVGIADNLTLEVTDNDGNVIDRINIGNGYEAGAPIDLPDGVSVSLSAGTVVDGDTFTTELVAEPDETGFLTALGINSFFSGVDASTIEVDPDILADSGKFAASISDAPADSKQVERFIELSNTQFLDDERLTFNDYLIEFTTSVGVDVRTTERLSGNLTALSEQYQRERDSISGVDINEEFVRLQQYQRSYEASVRVIQTAESLLDELFTILR